MTVIFSAKCLICPARFINGLISSEVMLLPVYLRLCQPFPITEVDAFPARFIRFGQAGVLLLFMWSICLSGITP